MNMIREVKSGTYEYNGNKVNYKYYNNMSISEKITFIDAVTNVVVGDNYNYVIKDIMFDFYLITSLSDIDVSFMNDENNEINIDNVCDFIENTTVIDEIKNNISNDLFVELYEALNKNIEYKTGIHNNDIVDTLTEFINIVNSKIDSIDIDKISPLVDSMNKIVNNASVENIVKEYRKQVKEDNKFINKKKWKK